MDYKSIYSSLIELRKATPATGYTERHHVLPRCMGGTDVADNLVVLTGREHWVAHLLLYKIHKSAKLLYACHMMAMRCEERGIPRIKSSRMYEAIRKTHANYMRKLGKKRIGELNGSYGTRWISNALLRENKRIPKTVSIPYGWFPGCNIWHRPPNNPKRRPGPVPTKPPRRKKPGPRKKRDNSKFKVRYNELFNKFIRGNYSSVRDFHRQELCDELTLQALCSGFRKFVPAYKTLSKEGKAFNTKGV